MSRSLLFQALKMQERLFDFRIDLYKGLLYSSRM